ncbi:MAG: hypothetical protein RSD36_08925 [Terrisporobacter sp.]
MKVKKIMLAMIIATSVTSCLMVGCTSSAPNIDKENYTVEEISDLKKDLSKRISKDIKSSGLRLIEARTDGSFVLSLGNLEYMKNPPKQVINYSMTTNKGKNKEILSLHCVREFSYDEKLSDDNKFMMATYNIYKSLTNTKLSGREFFDEVEKVFNKGEGTVKLPNMGDVIIEVNKVDKSTKTLELRLDKEFTLK